VEQIVRSFVASPSFAELVDPIEGAVVTPVQTAVEREDARVSSRSGTRDSA